MLTKYIAVDAGRYGCKFGMINPDGKTVTKQMFTSKFGYADFNFLKTTSGISFKEKTDIICKINDGRELLLGDTCDKFLPSEKIISVTEDEIYLEYSTYYVLAAIAKLVNNYDEVILMINLTYNNMNYTKEIAQKLKGLQKVIFYDTKGKIVKEVCFTIKKLAPYYQGWPSVMYRSINNETLIYDPKYKKDGIVIDVGNKTTDVSLVRELDCVSGRSYDWASRNIFIEIAKKIYEDFKVNLSNKDVEKLIIDNEVITDRTGNEINARKYLADAVLFISENIRTMVIDDFGKYQPRWVIITGGGIFYFKEILTKMFHNAEALDEPVFSNTLGMLKMLRKFELGE
jgi:hypothetical protein